MPTTRINRNRPKDSRMTALQELSGKLQTWYALKRQAAELTKRVNMDKAEIKAAVETFGVADEKGSLFVELPVPVSGIAALKNQKTVSDGFNKDEAEKISRSKGCYDDWVEMVPVFDTDAIRAAYFDKKISKAQLDRIFPKSESFSLILLNEDGKQVS